MSQSHKEKLKLNKEIYRMAIAKKPLNEIAFDFGLREYTIRHICLQVGGKLSDKNIKRNKDIYTKVLSGKSFHQVENEIGLSKERIRQIYRKMGGTILPYKEKKRKELLKKGMNIAEKYIKIQKIFPLKQKLLQFLKKKQTSTYITEIYKRLKKKYLNIPSHKTIRKQKRKEKLLIDLKQLYRKVKMPLSKYHLNKYRFESVGTYIYYFGMFKNACKLAGVPCGKRGGNAKEKSHLIHNSLLMKY